MPVFISLLRGINVGGNKLIKMDTLRPLYESLGLKQVRSHLQSGNLVFESRGTDRVKLSGMIEAGIEKRFGFHVAIVIRSAAELKEVIARIPFAEYRQWNPSQLLITFLASQPEEEAKARILRLHEGPEQLQFDGKQIYVHFPDGVGRSRLALLLNEKQFKGVGTARNLNTLTKLLEIVEAIEARATRASDRRI